MAPDKQHYVDEITSPLTINVYPKGASSFELYEDDGESYDYERDLFSITTITSNDNGKDLLIQKGAPVGKFKIPEKDFIFCIHMKPGAQKVFHEGRPLPCCMSPEELDLQNEGWWQENEGKRLIWIKISCEVSDKVDIKVSF